MAEYGEWNRKGAALSDVTAQKEYGLTRDFIVKGIQDGKLEFRDGAVWGNPYLRVLRSQLEPYIRDEEILDSIKTHVLKKVARIGRFRRFTWRVRCERHRRFCRSS